LNITTGVLVFIGTILVLVGVLKKPPRAPLKRTELDALCDARVQYLPQLQSAFIEYFNEIERIISSESRLLDFKTYGKYKPSLTYPFFFIDNIEFRKAQDEDKELFKIKQKIDTYNSKAKDKRVRKFAEGLPRACQWAYSYVIYTHLCRKEYGGDTPFVIRIWFAFGDKMQIIFRRHLNKINIVIQDLLEGAEDEL